MSDWRKDYDRACETFTAQNVEGCNYHLRVVFAVEIPNVEQAARSGDTDAVDVMNQITHWFEMVERAINDDVWPGCACCPEEVHRGEARGWVLMTPVNPDAAIALCGVLCRDCAVLGRDEILRRMAEQLVAQFDGLEIARTH